MSEDLALLYPSASAAGSGVLKDALVLVADELRDIPWFVLLRSLAQTLRMTMHRLGSSPEWHSLLAGAPAGWLGGTLAFSRRVCTWVAG
jgi:hypothetical protein